MILSGTLLAESPIYRGNSKKTLFTRNADGKEKLVSLAGRVEGTAQSLMDAFVGESKNRRNKGLINKLWARLFNEDMPVRLVKNVSCVLKKNNYAKENFFDLRMGLKLDEDRMASESGKNYKFETVFKNAEFDFKIDVNMGEFKINGNGAKLISIFDEMKAGRFWYGAGKSKGLGRCKLILDANLPTLPKYPKVNPKINHLTCHISFNTKEPILVGWNWGKVDPTQLAFTDVEGKYLIDGMRFLPEAIKTRMSASLGGAISNLEAWKKEFFSTLPKAITFWLKLSDQPAKMSLVIDAKDVNRLTKGKFPLSKKTIEVIQPILGKAYESKTILDMEFNSLLGAKEAKKNRRVLELAKSVKVDSASFSEDKWQEISSYFDLTDEIKNQAQENFSDDQKIEALFKTHIAAMSENISLQVDQQTKLLQSDPWVEDEIEVRKEHKRIKEMLLNRQITEQEWGDFRSVPKGISAASWREFLQSHDRVQYSHILNAKNLNKSIVNDKNIIDFLTQHKIKTHQELSQPENIDFRSGGIGGRTVSKNYGKPYDSVFMRMLSWSKKDGDSLWEVYVPGSTIKGAFRKRATQVLRALWGESNNTDNVLNGLFGAQREPGLLRFSDAYPIKQEVSRNVWCAMDAVKIDPNTGKPTDQTKSDYLYAYGESLNFDLRVDLQDIGTYDHDLMALFACLLKDFNNGDIPLGSDKTSGLGWVKANINKLDWRFADSSQTSEKFFDISDSKKDSFWNNSILEDKDALKWIDLNAKIKSNKDRQKIDLPIPEMKEGYTSHRSFGGYCGTLVLDGEVLTPIHVQESGEPSYSKLVQNKNVSGWDFFAMASPENEFREESKDYALPSKTVRGMLRNIYSMATNSSKSGRSIASLNEAEKLFGWVGDGINQALMGRISVGFAKFSDPELSWFGAPTKYGEWDYYDNKWEKVRATVQMTRFANEWRIFPHAPTAPCVQNIGDDFTPSHPDLSYLRAIMPKSKCQLKIRFWNLSKEELERLIWCSTLEHNLAHKVGKLKQLGLGSLRFKLSDESHLINWSEKYSGSSEGEHGLSASEWYNPETIKNHVELKKFLNADSV